MMISHTARIATPDGGGLRAFPQGTGSFGATQGIRTQTAS
jgi:hypothetical protein